MLWCQIAAAMSMPTSSTQTELFAGLRAVVTSDLHLGSPHARVDAYRTLLQALPDDVTLILNGDTLDRSRSDLPEDHRALLDEILAQSARRTVIWIRGNHDEIYEPPGLVVQEGHQMGDVYITHGHGFQASCLWLRPFFRGCKALIWARTSCQGASVHPAAYAKRWPRLYGWLCNELRQNAFAYAQSHQCQTVICGHVHFAEDTTCDGLRYLNSGAWTEDPSHAVFLYDNRIDLVTAPDTKIRLFSCRA